MSSISSFFHRLWNTNEKVTSAGLTAMGEAAKQSALGAIAMLLRRDSVAEISAAFAGDSLKCSWTAGLDVDVNAGSGLMVDATASGSFPAYLLPIVLEAADAVTVATYSANPRIDVVYYTPATVDDTSAVVRVWNDGTNVFDPTALDTRRLVSGSVSVVTGVAAATPAVPSVPAGSIALAHVHVPATSGDLDVRDARTRLTVEPPGFNAEHGAGWVPDTTPGSNDGSLLVTASGVALEATIAAAVNDRGVYAGGKLWPFPEDVTVALAASPAVSPRYDLIVVDVDGQAAVLEGVEGGLVPTPSPGQAQLAATYTTAGAAAPSLTFDLRQRYPISGDFVDDLTIETRHIAAEAVQASKLSFDVGGIFDLAVGAESGDQITVTFVAKDADEAAGLANEPVLIELFGPAGQNASDVSNAPLIGAGTGDPTLGTRVTTLGGDRAIFNTAAGGFIEFQLAGSVPTVGTFYLKVSLLERAGVPAYIAATFA